ncbi:retrovirus-related pol polyprotein from transposon TNT 1-94 [Tanacetum coccineum]
MELHDVSYGIEYVARPLLLFFSSENRLLWFRYREYDLAHLKLVFEFSIYNVWKSVQSGVSNGLDTAYWGFFRARIRHIFLMDTAYWSSETKMPMAVPISTREPKRTMNQSAATPLKRTITSESTNQKPRSKIRKQYEQIIKTCSRGTNLYSITLQDISTPNLICFMAKASSSQAWVWHRRLSHLNFDTINLLSMYDIMTGLPKLKFVKDHLFSYCELGKAKRKSFKIKTTPSSKRRLQILHMDLCGLMRVESFNRKKYVVVIVDDYSRYTLTHFLRCKDETPKVLINFLKLFQRGLHAQVRTVRTDKGT